MANAKKIGDILILIGGIIGIIEGILQIIGWAPILPTWLTIYITDGLIMGILGIIFSLIALVNSGTIKIKALEFKSKWIVVLAMGILMYLFASGIGGIAVMIGSILLLFK